MKNKNWINKKCFKRFCFVFEIATKTNFISFSRDRYKLFLNTNPTLWHNCLIFQSFLRHTHFLIDIGSPPHVTSIAIIHNALHFGFERRALPLENNKINKSHNLHNFYHAYYIRLNTSSYSPACQCILYSMIITLTVSIVARLVIVIS